MALELIRDRDRLVAALRERGVDYLMPEDAAGEPVGDEALIAVFLLHPEVASLVRTVRKLLRPSAEIELVAHYMAAIYLRQIWATRLSHYLPAQQPLPDYFSQSLQLNSPQAGYGEIGLRELAAWHSHHAAWRGNHLSEYESVPDHVFDRLKRRARQDAASSTG